MSAQISVEDLSKRYYLGQPAKLQPTDLKTRAINAMRRLQGRPPLDIQSDSLDSLWALKGVSFEVQQGERLGIVGRNGSGKSTLLKILSRVTDPTEGCARLRGRVGSLLEVGTGFHPDLTGRDNILLNGAVLGMTRAEIRRKFDEIVDFAEIERFIDSPVKHYSSGMYVRLAFSVAAHLESEILIVDEVMAVGDAAFQRKCMHKMEGIADEGKTVLFVSHATSSVMRLCTHAILLDAGQLKAHGNANEVVHEYLGRQLTSRTLYEVPPDPSKAMALRAVALNPESPSRMNDLPYESDIRLRIEYDVYKEIEDVSVWFSIQTVEGENVLVSADHDNDISMLGRRKRGHYVADALLPGRQLNTGEYLVVVGIVRNRPLEVYNREETLTFKILETDTPARRVGEAGRAGALQVFLDWTCREPQ